MNIVLPDNGTKYSYKIDPINGISLVIQGPNNSDIRDQEETTPTDLLDSDPPSSFEAPVLKATRTLLPTPTPAPALAPARAPAATPAKNHTDVDKKAVTNTTKTRLKIANPQIWDSEEERAAAYREHIAGWRGRIDPDGNGTPLVFKEGLCGRSSGPHDSEEEEEKGKGEDPTARSRMVVFSGLHPATTYPELLDKVRGGPVLHVVRADSTTAVVSFVMARDAHAYVNYVNDASRRRRRRQLLTIRGVAPRVTLVATPSYPLRAYVAPGVAHRGVTRCLEIPDASRLFCWTLDAFFTTRKLWAFTETRDIEYVVVTVDDDDDDDGNDDDQQQQKQQQQQHEEEEGVYNNSNDEMLEDTMVEEWVVVDHNDKYRLEPKQTPRPPPTKTRVLRVSFRDVLRAEMAHGLIARSFRGCGVRYAPDRCAGPLEELDE
ncbi:hypothetical protein F5B21DRAFT_467890 [Xylaria acuta]|nr:hypothetical protein F5B21DRAFT_467890 [Xylaria acuta]